MEIGIRLRRRCLGCRIGWHRQQNAYFMEAQRRTNKPFLLCSNISRISEWMSPSSHSFQTLSTTRQPHYPAVPQGNNSNPFSFLHIVPPLPPKPPREQADLGNILLRPQPQPSLNHIAASFLFIQLTFPLSTPHPSTLRVQHYPRRLTRCFLGTTYLDAPGSPTVFLGKANCHCGRVERSEAEMASNIGSHCRNSSPRRLLKRRRSTRPSSPFVQYNCRQTLYIQKININ